MSALPTRKLEAYRYADIEALASVWNDLAPPRSIEVPAGEVHRHIALPTEEAVDVRRATILLQPGAELTLFALNSAERYGRLEMDVTLHEGARFTFNGANLGGGTATLEIVSTVRHLGPGATSTQMIRSVLGGKATGSFMGKIAVAREGQQTDAVQSVKAMLLDRGATANAKPELEIYADDVKCAHGATVGELDREQLFYAASRGMPPSVARALLLEGFVGGLWDELGDDEQAIAEVASQKLRDIA